MNIYLETIQNYNDLVSLCRKYTNDLSIYSVDKCIGDSDICIVANGKRQYKILTDELEEYVNTLTE